MAIPEFQILGSAAASNHPSRYPIVALALTPGATYEMLCPKAARYAAVAFEYPMTFCDTLEYSTVVV